LKEHQSISELVSRILPENEDSPVEYEMQKKLLDNWRVHSGIVAAHTYPLWFKSGRIVAICDSSVWATQVKHQHPSLLLQLKENKFNVSEMTTKIIPSDSIIKPGFRPRQKASPISKQNSLKMKRMSDGLSHPRLKESLSRLASKFE